MSILLAMVLLARPADPPPAHGDVTVITCTSPRPFERRPDFLSATPTYGPEELYIVVLKGRPDLSRRVPAPNRIGNP